MKESKFAKGVITSVAVLFLSLPIAATANAADELKGRSVKVKFADLNLQKEEGAAALYRRLRQASKRVCGVESIKNSGGVRVVAEQKRCYRETLDAAVAQIDNAELKKIHEG